MAMDFSGNDFIGLGYGDSRTAVNDESSNLSSSPLNRPQHYSGANFVRPQYPSHESNNREKVSAPNPSRWGAAKSTPTKQHVGTKNKEQIRITIKFCLPHQGGNKKNI